MNYRLQPLETTEINVRCSTCTRNWQRKWTLARVPKAHVPLLTWRPTVPHVITGPYTHQPTSRSIAHRASTGPAAETSAEISQNSSTAQGGESRGETSAVEEGTTARQGRAQEGRNADEVDSQGGDAEASGEASSDVGKLPEGQSREGEEGSSQGIPSIDEVVENVSSLAQELRRVAADARSMLRSMAGVQVELESQDTVDESDDAVPQEKSALYRLLTVRKEVSGAHSALTSSDEEKRGRLEEALHSLDSAIEGVRSQASLAHLSEVLNVWEERLDVHAGPALKGVVGEYAFNDMELDTFRHLVRQMRSAAFGLFAVTIAIWVNQVISMVMLHRVAKVSTGITLGGICLSRYTAVANSLVFGWLIWMGAVSFKGVLHVGKEGQLTYAMQGIIQLGIIFMQMAPMTLCFAIINVLEAAIRWPGIMPLTATLFALYCVLRGASLFLLLGRYRPGSLAAAQALLAMHDGVDAVLPINMVEKTALNIVAGGILPYSPRPVQAAAISMEETIDMSDSRAEFETGMPLPPGHEYEFTRWEERILEVVMDSMRSAGTMAAIQAVSTALLGIAVMMQSDYYGAYCYIMVDLIEQSWRSAILFASAGCFQKVLTTEGHDISYLLEGLGQEKGIGHMFGRFQKVLWGSAFWRTIDISIRLLVSTVLWHELCAKLGPIVTGFVTMNYSKIRFLLATVGLS